MRFILTFIGVLIFGVTYALGMGGTTVALIIALILTGIGILISMITGDGLKERLIDLAIHAVIWVVGFVLCIFLVPVIIIAVFAFVADHFFLGGEIRAFIWDHVSGAQSDGSVRWPHAVYDDANYQYVLIKTYGEYADYFCETLNNTVSVSASNVGTNTMSTIYGTLHW